MQIQLKKHRTEALSDGLFAIVMTLLVLELKVPELHRPASDQQILAKITELVPRLGIIFDSSEEIVGRLRLGEFAK